MGGLEIGDEYEEGEEWREEEVEEGECEADGGVGGRGGVVGGGGGGEGGWGGGGGGGGWGWVGGLRLGRLLRRVGKGCGAIPIALLFLFSSLPISSSHPRTHDFPFRL